MTIKKYLVIQQNIVMFDFYERNNMKIYYLNAYPIVHKRG